MGKEAMFLLRRKFRLARVITSAMLFLLVVVVVAANRDDVVQAQRLASVLVNVNVDGTQRDLRTAQTTVGSILREARIEVGPQDVVTPATDERPYYGMKITVVRVRNDYEENTLPMAFGTVKTFSSSLPPGSVQEIKPGVKGEKKVRYRVKYRDGSVVERVPIISWVLKKPVARVVSIGSRGRYMSRGGFTTRTAMAMVATAYDPSPRSCGRGSRGRTSNGMRAGYGVVAVDPKVIRMGSPLYVEGYGYAVAGDIGGSIKGKRVDLGFNSYSEARRYGRKRVTVHVLQR